MRDRNYRRTQQTRIEKRTYHMMMNSWWYECVNLTEEEIHRKAKYFANNRAKCSCQMCRNPRRCSWNSKKEKLTIQERKGVDMKDTSYGL